MKSESHSVLSDSSLTHRLYITWNFPGQNTGVGSSSLFQGIFPTQGTNPGLPHCRWIFYQLSHQGSPGILEWVAYPVSSRSSWPRNWTWVSCIAGGFASWATREALLIISQYFFIKCALSPQTASNVILNNPAWKHICSGDSSAIHRYLKN